MISAKVKRYDLTFITPGKTSRGVLYEKPSWFIRLKREGIIGTGECSVIPGLSPEYTGEYEQKISDTVRSLSSGIMPGLHELDEFPSIRFGLETALLDLKHKEQGVLFPSLFTQGKAGIPINGLIWMGSREEMQKQIREKLALGFKVLKLKIGGLAFDEELSMLREVRKEFTPEELEVRLDANGAFAPAEALEKMKQLSEFHIHSIEQPVQPGQWNIMADLCMHSPIPVALDEELIGIHSATRKEELLTTIQPHYIILKPSLAGGLEKSMEWIETAQKLGVKWWVTSALESNVGLNAIAQWVFTLQPKMVQGLGTGKVFSNNLPSPLTLMGPELFYLPR